MFFYNLKVENCLVYFGKVEADNAKLSKNDTIVSTSCSDRVVETCEAHNLRGVCGCPVFFLKGIIMKDKEVLSAFMSGYDDIERSHGLFNEGIDLRTLAKALEKLADIIDATTLTPESMGGMYLESQDYDLMCEDEYV